MKKVFLTALVTGLLSVNLTASAAYAVAVTNWQDNAATVNQLITQVEKAEAMIKNQQLQLKSLDPKNLTDCLSQLNTTIDNINSIRQQTDAIGSTYSKFLTEWDDANPDYSAWNGFSAEKLSQQNMKNRQRWSKALKQALGVSSIAGNENQLDTNQQLNQLLNASQNVEGTKQAIQVLTQLCGVMLTEQQKLSSLMAESIRSQAMYQEMQLNASNAGDKFTKELFKDSGKYDNVKLKDHGGNYHQFR